MDDTDPNDGEERTDPSVLLPESRGAAPAKPSAPARSASWPPSALPPRAPPPALPRRPSAPPLPPLKPLAASKTSSGITAGALKSSPPPALGKPAEAKPAASPPAKSASSLSTPAKTTPSSPPPAHGKTASSPPLPPLKSSPGSMPPPRMPRPSDAPPPNRAAADPGPLQRQRLAQMETQLDEARSTIARQRNEIEELRSRIEAGDAKLGDLARDLADDGRTQALERRLAELESARGSFADDLRREAKLAADVSTEEHGERVAKIEERLRAVEDSAESSRIRMRLERVGTRLDQIELRLGSLEDGQRAAIEAREQRDAAARKQEARVLRLESLFDELKDELRRSDHAQLETLRERIDDVEGLVTKVASKSMAPPPMPAARSGGDDLTQIKGIGPKTAAQLGAMGITSFAQIAAWGDDDIERAATQLGIPSSRIKKGKWTESAARLAG
jgi:predicted flap endonuclease-1-like 5' DNA nuclease